MQSKVIMSKSLPLLFLEKKKKKDKFLVPQKQPLGT